MYMKTKFLIFIATIASLSVLVSDSIKEVHAQQRVCGYGGSTNPQSCTARLGTACSPCSQGTVCTVQGEWSYCAPAAYSAAEEYVRSKNIDGGQGSKGMMRIMIDALGDEPIGSGGTGAAYSAITAMYYSPPASGTKYVADTIRNLRIPGVKEAQAQGFGAAVFEPVIELWKLSRNIALVGFTLIFTIVGLMIMMRSKIDPRTVITIQQAIPKIVVALIMVIFSYAIVGFLVDITQLITRVGAVLLQQNRFIASNAGGAPGTGEQLDGLLRTNIFGLMFPMTDFQPLTDRIKDLPFGILNPLQALSFLDAFTGGGGTGLLRLVLAFAIFVAIVRTFFMLIEAYLKVTLGLILSPFQFLLMAIPGQGHGLGDWFRGMLSNLLIFPAVFFMLAFAAIFYMEPGNSVAQGTNWGVGRVTFYGSTSYWAPPGLGDWGVLVGPLLSLAILLTVPKAGAAVKELVNPAKKPSALEGEVGRSIQSAASRIPIVGSLTKF